MRVLVIGAGGVGSSVGLIARRRDFFESMLVADIDAAKASAFVDRLADPRFSAAELDAGDPADVAELCRQQRITHVVNAADPRHVMSIFTGAYQAGAHYLDMALSRSTRHPEQPFNKPGVLLGQTQFDDAELWGSRDRLALVGMGARPGLVDVFARHAADELFSTIDRVDVRAGSNLVMSRFDFAPSFSTWATIEECLNPPLVWQRDTGFQTTELFADPEVFDFPDGIGPVRCVAIEHGEVVLVPRAVDADAVTFKIGLGEDFIEVLTTLRMLGLDRTDPVQVDGQWVSPRDVVAACLPDPSTLGEQMTGRTCVGTLVTGTGRDGAARCTYLYHVADNEWTMREYGAQAVVWQTALNPVVALELLATRVWSAAGVLGPESLPARPFLDLLANGYDQQWQVQERTPAG